MQRRTCILVTHHVELCTPIAKFAILMNAGQIAASGTPSMALFSLPSTNDSALDVDNTTSSPNVQIKDKKGKEDAYRVQETSSNASSGVHANGVYVEQETYTSGEISTRVYKIYIHAAGYRF
jgi:ABC-type multidrug transport system ATPase subunit